MSQGIVDFSPYLAGLVARARAARHGRAQRAAAARAKLPAVVRLLVEDFGARRVVLFGSLAAGGFHEDSDIDLLVEGIAPERWYEADARAAAAADPFELDLVPASAARSSVLRRAVREGEVLHDGTR
ncbi:MAG: nucleotidyltransferase domain-containing protein [Deltaproteobacteria bacterium]|nr:nucleotidyltransferase domain-containing protein [Deltaproteobacteria bacterium]